MLVMQKKGVFTGYFFTCCETFARFCIHNVVWSKLFPLFTLIYFKMTCLALSH